MYTYGCKFNHRILGRLSRLASWKKTNSLTSGHQFPEAAQLGVELHESFLTSAGILDGLILLRSCEYSHSCRYFMGAMALSSKYSFIENIRHFRLLQFPLPLFCDDS